MYNGVLLLWKDIQQLKGSVVIWPIEKLLISITWPIKNDEVMLFGMIAIKKCFYLTVS